MKQGGRVPSTQFMGAGAEDIQVESQGVKLGGADPQGVNQQQFESMVVESHEAL